MGEISNLEYKMTWIDHLDALYSSFIRRNNPDEWFYFPAQTGICTEGKGTGDQS